MSITSRALGLIRGSVKVEGQELALERGTLEDIKRIEREVLRTMGVDEQDLLKEKKVLKLIKDVEDELIKLRKDQTYLRQVTPRLVTIEKEIAALSGPSSLYSKHTSTVQALHAERVKIEKRLNYDIIEAQKIVNDILAKVAYITEIMMQVKSHKALELQSDTVLQKWCREAGARAREMRRELDQIYKAESQIIRLTRAESVSHGKTMTLGFG